MPVALMLNLVVKTLESIVSFGFFKFLCFGADFHYFPTCIQNVISIF